CDLSLLASAFVRRLPERTSLVPDGHLESVRHCPCAELLDRVPHRDAGPGPVRVVGGVGEDVPDPAVRLFTQRLLLLQRLHRFNPTTEVILVNRPIQSGPGCPLPGVEKAINLHAAYTIILRWLRPLLFLVASAKEHLEKLDEKLGPVLKPLVENLRAC